jgi:hypothetical protein
MFGHVETVQERIEHDFVSATPETVRQSAIPWLASEIPIEFATPPLLFF